MASVSSNPPAGSGFRRKLHGVHAFRGYAALLVVFCHAADTAGRYSGNRHLDWLIEGGLIGVAFFFVLSGFIMAYVHGSDPHTPAAGRAFCWKRIVRVVPAYWIVTLLIFAAVRMGGNWGEPEHRDPLSLVRSLFFIPSREGPIVRVGWTLHHEMLFYALFAVAWYVVKLPRVLIGLWMAWIVARGAMAGFAMTAPEGVQPWWIYWSILVDSPLNLLFGMGLLVHGVASRVAGREPGAGQTLWMLALSSGLLLGLWILACSGVGGELPGMGWWKRVAYGVASGAVLAALTFPAVSKFFDHPVNTLLGNASYSIYLIHYYAQAAAAKVLGHFSFANHTTFVWLALVVVGLAGGILFHFAVEKPVTRFISARFKHRPAPVSNPAA